MSFSFRGRAAACAGVLSALVLFLTAPASAGGQGHGPNHDQSDQPTDVAQSFGVDTAGGGFMGWHDDASGPTGPATTSYTGGVYGLDVASYQGNVNWSSYYSAGKRFAYVKATEGTSYTNPYFSQQYNGSYNAGMIRGAYHFGRPDVSSGATQADYFVGHGGGWSADGKTLPGTLDIEFNPYGAECYGLSQASMRSWIASFLGEYKARTGRDAVIYTNYYWWVDCTGNTTAFNQANPLWIAHYGSDAGTLPGGWGYFTIWQYTDSPVDQDYFNGAYSRLQALALG